MPNGLLVNGHRHPFSIDNLTRQWVWGVGLAAAVGAGYFLAAHFSLNRPGANVTGVTFIYTQLGAKRLELLRQFMPKASAVAMLVNPDFPPASVEVSDVQAAAQSFGLQINVLKASTEREISWRRVTLSLRSPHRGSSSRRVC